jgi:acetyl-CoA carboxylase carboxyl transferase subunit alpha
VPNDPEQARRELEAMDRRLHELAGQIAEGQDTTSRQRYENLQHFLADLRADLNSRLTPWQRVKLARHPQRPYFLDLAQYLFADFSEIHGDRSFADDKAVVCGMAAFNGRPCVVVGQQKGRSTKDKLFRNFGMLRPEGYRKALRVMQVAAKFRRPIFTFLDTPGAYPGMDAEARGQAEAIARNLREMARLPVPVIVTCIGEGGSGGALGIGIGDHVLIMENAVYSVISPESCAAIVWRDAAKAELAAAALKLTAQDLLGLNLVDEIVPEPPGGAQEDHKAAAELLRPALEGALAQFEKMPAAELLERRYQKLRHIAQFFEARQGVHA